MTGLRIWYPSVQRFPERITRPVILIIHNGFTWALDLELVALPAPFAQGRLVQRTLFVKCGIATCLAASLSRLWGFLKDDRILMRRRAGCTRIIVLQVIRSILDVVPAGSYGGSISVDTK